MRVRVSRLNLATINPKLYTSPQTAKSGFPTVDRLTGKIVPLVIVSALPLVPLPHDAATVLLGTPQRR